jgi:hypothetical protein
MLAPIEGTWRCMSQGVFWDQFGFRVHWCGFMYESSNLWISSLAMFAVMARWSFAALARIFLAYALRQVLKTTSFVWLRYGGARTMAHLRLTVVSLVVIRWSKRISSRAPQSGPNCIGSSVWGDATACCCFWARCYPAAPPKR